MPAIEMSVPPEFPFKSLIAALIDESMPLEPRHLYRLSDLNKTDLELLESNWERISLSRRQELMKGLEEMSKSDYLLSFAEVGQLAIKDADPRVRLHAVRMLSEYEINKLIPVFLEMLESDVDVKVRAACATALGPFDYLGEIEELKTSVLRRIEDHLLRVINGQDDQLVRRRALEAMGFSSRKEIPPLIEAAYHSGDNEWLVTSLFAMGRSANSRWNNQVLEMLDHLIPAVRTEAATAAGELEISEAVHQLIELLDDSDAEVRSAAIWSLSQIGGEGVRDALVVLLEATEDEEEADLLEAALDNLSFTEDMASFNLMDYEELEDDELEDELIEETDEDFNIGIYPQPDEEGDDDKD
jgi:HEAT repeat protein